MEQLKHILTVHARRYPEMRPQDAVKLLYQRRFGPGHLVQDPSAALQRLRDEWALTPADPTAPLLENIGNGLVRVMLPAWSEEEYPAEALNDDFVRSARIHTGSLDDFSNDITFLRELTVQGILPFSVGELDSYLKQYTAAGRGVVSHSEEYRQAYCPAYRVVHKDCISISPAAVISKEIARRKSQNRPLLVAIDGRCASGKTTLAAQLQSLCSCAVVHMDDFFLRPEQRSQKRYDTPGENVDHERFLQEVLLPLYHGSTAQYRPFDCAAQRLSDPVQVQPLPVVVVEGSYSCHRDLFPYYDLTVFLSVPPEVQMERIVKREGTEYAKVFREQWIPLEEAYFAHRDLDLICDFSFPCGSAAPPAEDS